MERFSIRGYTSNMRSTDVLKCWPFDETKTEFIEAFLPPITVQKFKWWADGLDNKEAEAATNGMSCPVCLVFTAGTATAVNTHVDRCLAQSSRKEQIRMKSKSRVPKKRSIVEIFAVAPQVEKLYDDEDADEDEDGGDFLSTEDDDDVKLSALIHVGSNDKRKKKMKLEDRTLAIVTKLKKLKGVKKNKNGKKERDIAPIDLSVPNKEKPLKLKKKYPLGSTGNCNGSSYTMDLAKELLDVIPVQKRKPRPKCYVEGKKKTSGTSKLTLEKQKSVLSVRGILKNNSKVVLRKKSTTCTLRESSKTNWCGINQSDRRVRFSGKDDILGQRRKSFPPIEFPKLQNIFCSYSDAGSASIESDRSAERGKKFVSMDVYGSDGSSCISKEELQSITEKQSSDTCLCVGKPNFLRPCTSQEHLRNRPVALNQVAYCSENLHWLEHGYKVALPETISACPPGFLSTEREAFMPNMITQGGDNMSISSGSNVKVIANAHYGDPCPSLAAICSRDYVNSFPQPSSSHFLKDNGNGYGRLLFPSETTPENYNGQTLQHHPCRHLSPKELMRSICSLPDIDQRGVMRLERSMNEDFVGLPLNSQGEFIQLNSSDKVGFNQLMRPSTVSDSSRTLALCSELPSDTGDHLNFNNCHERAPSKKQFQFFPVQDRVKENPNFIVSSRLGITGPQTGRGDVPFLDYLRGSSQSVYPLKSGLDLMNIPTCKYKQDDQIWNHSSDRNMRQERNPDLRSLNVTQPTMRLMGQNFSVGNNYRNVHEDEMVWMDKQIIAEHRPADTTINNSLRRHFQSDLVMQSASGKGKKIACPAEIQFNLASQSFLQIKPPDSRFSQPSLSCQTNAVYENTCRTFSGDPVGRSYPYFPPDASPALFNKEPIFQEPFVYEYEPLPVNPRPIRASSPHIAFQNLSLNYTQSNKKHPQHYSTNSAFKFPFLRPDLGEHVRPSCCQSSFKNLPPWLLNATQVKETMIGSFKSYSDAGGSCHPCTMSSDNFQKIPSVSCKPDASYIYNPLSIQSPLQNAPGLAPITQSPLIPVRHRFLPTMTMNNRREYRMKFKERMKARLCFKDSAHGKRTKKGPAAKLDYSANPSKLCNMEISEDLSRSVVTLKAIGDAGADVIGRRETFGLDLAKDISKSMACGQDSSQMDASKASTEINPFKLDGIAIPGPVKLTAGAKHILKPSESMSHESNSRLTHSKIPFAAVASSGTVSESQMKSAKIYRF